MVTHVYVDDHGGTEPQQPVRQQGSDVNLATYLLVEGAQRLYDTAVVVTNDSDLALPVEVVQNTFNRRVGVINPHHPRKRSRDLKPSFVKQLRRGVLAASQFPDVLTDARGEFRKPSDW